MNGDVPATIMQTSSVHYMNQSVNIDDSATNKKIRNMIPVNHNICFIEPKRFAFGILPIPKGFMMILHSLEMDN